jgi:hypothetical protein
VKITWQKLLADYSLAERRFETPRALAVNVRVRRHDNLNVTGLAVPPPVHAAVLIHESRKMLKVVRNRLNLQLHRWSLVRWFAFLVNSPNNLQP